ncbi:MAG: monovalent cation/H(+) antiporter subunit G [Pseudomonadota bacterium]|nr:monovalent cation/H(+) antiporter subunit G [Pseudomonadota bacterium]
MFLDVLSWILLLSGGVFGVISAVGVLRMPDVYTRMHAASIADTIAIGLTFGGMMLQAGLTIITIKLVLILVFIFFASPTTTHALAKAAIAGGIKPILHEDRRKKTSNKKPKKRSSKTPKKSSNKTPKKSKGGNS